MTTKFLAANWKMKGDLALCQAYAKEFSAIHAELEGKTEILVCPPAPFLGWLDSAIREPCGGQILLGTQDITKVREAGANTGEIHPDVLKETGCSHAIIGHSERRSVQGEDDQLIGEKMGNCLAHGITPILCVGESAEQRDAGESEQVIAGQLDKAFAVCKEHASPQWPEVLIAYEPFWAIGSGKAATPDIIRDMHGFIRERLGNALGLDREQSRILYGGSVKRDNIAEIAAIEGVDGGLIGGASLDAAHFAELALAFARA